MRFDYYFCTFVQIPVQNRGAPQPSRLDEKRKSNIFPRFQTRIKWPTVTCLRPHTDRSDTAPVSG